MDKEVLCIWKMVVDLSDSFYPIAGRNRHPYPLELVRRVRAMQNSFGLRSPSIDEAP